MYYQQKILALANMLRNSNRTFALTGAGISTESGIPDFRSPGTGLWTKHDPIKVATVSALLRDPATFYRINLERWIDFTKAKPNAAHYALARLERDGLLAGVITQNIDGLHLAAGSQKVWEVHGHLRTCHCLHCGESYSFDILPASTGPEPFRPFVTGAGVCFVRMWFYLRIPWERISSTLPAP